MFQRYNNVSSSFLQRIPYMRFISSRLFYLFSPPIIRLTAYLKAGAAAICNSNSFQNYSFDMLPKATKFNYVAWFNSLLKIIKDVRVLFSNYLVLSSLPFKELIINWVKNIINNNTLQINS